MGYKSISVQMTPEHFDRSIKGSPKEAIKELIWNACDADAKNIEVSFAYGGIEGSEHVSDIFIRDDGHGIPYEYVEEYFGKYGCSQKSLSNKSPGGRIYHGKLGQGRYKCLSIANFIEWETLYTDGENTCLHCSSASDDSKRSHGAVERLKEGYPENVFASVFELPAFSALASLVFQNQGLQVF